MKEEDTPARAPGASKATSPGTRAGSVRLSQIDTRESQRVSTCLAEFDRVLGGGLVPGSIVLVGGEPGVGKSTLLLQAGAAITQADTPVLYVSGEESAQQIRQRADRLGVVDGALSVLCATDLESVEQAIEAERPRVAVVDSVQTLRADTVESGAGTLTQVRECAARLADLARRTQTAVVLVGHVTKEGGLAGPKVMEHIVDTVLLFEGERSQALKVLRAAKNRHGSTNEVGLFEMGDDGLREVANPSRLLLAERQDEAVGTVACASVEGTRPLLLEVQALVAPSPFAAPRRVVSGLDASRVHLILAVLEQHAGIRVSNADVYVNVAGGVRIAEPAGDLAVALAVASSVTGYPVPASWVVFGEVGLTGEVRTVSHAGRRLEEASRLGFAAAVLPRRGAPPTAAVALHAVGTVAEAVKAFRPDPGARSMMSSDVGVS